MYLYVLTVLKTPYLTSIKITFYSVKEKKTKHPLTLQNTNELTT